MLNERIYKLWLSLINAPIEARLMCRMETDMPRGIEKDRTMWFFMWFLASVATFGIAYFLSKDLILHEKRQRAFLAIMYPNLDWVSQSISIRNCVIITVATLGFGVIYWLYKLVNVYNNHFKEHQHLEAELGTLMEATSH